ncbi:MAG TPA: hypothetical protein VHY36_17235 [Steroidobacteraceae bacterium]|jgi:hypothetical protein|nr:hypothetical protein [Steroidobacteraceae bacterium]
MNTIQKATFAAGALAITLVGAALVTAPIAFARPLAAMVQNHCATAGVQAECSGLTRVAGLVALNRR